MGLILKLKVGYIVMPALLLLLILFIPARAFAQEEMDSRPQDRAQIRRPNPEGDLIRQLNLTPDQIEQIRAIRERNREARRAIGERIREARMALDRAIYMENADEAVVERLAGNLAEAQAAQVRLQAMTELGIRRLLTPAQLDTFRALRLRAEANRRNRRLRRDSGLEPRAPRGPGFRRRRP
jgi:Spy/CpxP family protein refolding chaperone